VVNANFIIKVKVKVGAELYTTMLLFQLTETFLNTYLNYVRVHLITQSLKSYSIESLHADISTCHPLTYSSLNEHSLGAEVLIHMYEHKRLDVHSYIQSNFASTFSVQTHNFTANSTFAPSPFRLAVASTPTGL
jgi:hypothetical protein